MAAMKMVGKVEYKVCLGGTTWLTRIGFEKEVEFIPGQFVSLKVSDEGFRRSYSIASRPGKKYIDLVVNVAPMGVGSKYILGLKIGDEVEVLGFMGKFVIEEEALDESVLFVANGVGVAPMRPMIEDLLEKKQFKGKVKLIWGMRHEEDLYWMKEIDIWQRDYDNFSFEVVLSQPKNDWPGLKGHVGEVVEKLDFDWQNLSVFICGSPEMVVEMLSLLKEKGVDEKKIIHERFA